MADAASFDKTCHEFDRLCAKASPDEEPYKFQYEARAVLNAFKTKVQEQLDAKVVPATELERLRDVLAACLRRLGVNQIMTEENQPGFEKLEEVTRLLADTVPAAPSTDAALEPQLLTLLRRCIELLYAYNFQAFMLSGWGKPNTALARLRTAKLVYRAATAAVLAFVSATPAATSDAAAAAATDAATDAAADAATDAGVSPDDVDVGLSSEPPACTPPTLFHAYARLPQAVRSCMDSVHALYTHTLFYLAQVHGNLGRSQRSSVYVEATLQRQLDLAARAEQLRRSDTPVPPVSQHNEPEQLLPLNYVEWASNALRLADYFTKTRQYTHSAYCLTAAGHMLQRREQEAVAEQAAAAAGSGEGGEGDAKPAADGTETAPTLPESFHRARAELSAHWGSLHLSVLSFVYSRVRHGLYGEPMPDEHVVETRAEKLQRRQQRRADREARARARAAKAADGPGDGAAAGAGAQATEPDDSDLEEATTSTDDGLLPVAAPEPATGGGAGVGAGVTVDGAAAADVPTRPHPFAAYLAAEAGVDVVRVPTPASVTDWDSARAVFMEGQKHFLAAKGFFVLDGFVSDHVGILMNLSRLFKYLTVWEPKPKRQLAMHQRRVDMLAPVPKVLNPTIFQNAIKEMSLSAAQAAQEVVMLRLQIFADAGATISPATLAKCKKEVDTAFGLFALFVRCYKDDRISEPLAVLHSRRPAIEAEPLNGATTLDEGSTEAYLTALFSIARLLANVPWETPQARVPDMAASIEQFKTVKRIAAAVVPAGSNMFKQELEAADEFISLLPSKISNAHYRGVV